jgi:acyl carrier protein
MSVRDTIEQQMKQIASDQNKRLAPLADDLPLLECGLDSLCFAILVARLEDELGLDPFLDAGDGAFPETVGQFVAFYERAAA